MPNLLQGSAEQVFNDEQMRVTPFLISKNYSKQLFECILSKDAYYNAVADLISLGLTQDIPELFADADKLRALELLNAVENKTIKQMCLIFWVKGALSTSDYDELIKVGNTYPLLADTLIALDKTGEYSMEELRACALNPQKQLQLSIIHHFASEFPVRKEILAPLDEHQLERLSRALLVLKSKEHVTQDLFVLAVQNNQKGYLLRLFLPSFSKALNQQHRDMLIDLLYEGVQRGPINLSKQVVAIKDEPLRIEALKLQDRLMCAKAMQRLFSNTHELSFLNELVSFAAEADDEKANKFRYVILRVEAQCKDIHQRLLRENKPELQQTSWQETEKEYRQALYKIAYQAIKNPSFDFKMHLDEEQNKALATVDPQKRAWMHNALIVIANIFITVLTFALANAYKYRTTGNFWFFNQSTSGEELRALGSELTERIQPVL